ncbi:ABC transporter permease [Oscillochloris sp. ZM17-4]|uniref:ABC transporter permease n=1 Tax=Oscillochloris sp. ZM17-4 TaxID=2866714 RepID=UPI001C7372E7|nr:ABC transporter permease [Oscillochloris sp. ZM17-4]MBX0327891.1 ABC transporter permease [Oscillochloris sp. ZM17-4]
MEYTTASLRTAERRPWRPRAIPRLGLLLVSLPMLVYLLLPILALITRIDPAALMANLISPELGQAIGLSITTTACSTALGLTLGTPLAYLLARRRFRGRSLLDTLVELPMVLPPSVAGIALLIAFGRRGMIGGWLDDLGLSLAFTTVAVVLAQTFVSAPFYIKTAVAGFAGVDREIEQAAEIDGASPLQVFAWITLPLAWPVLLGGLVMSWARALGEFGATIIFAGNFPGRTQTMPLAIYLGFELDLDLALTMALILLAVSFFVLWLVKMILRQQVDAP